MSSPRTPLVHLVTDAGSVLLVIRTAMDRGISLETVARMLDPLDRLEAGDHAGSVTSLRRILTEDLEDRGMFVTPVHIDPSPLEIALTRAAVRALLAGAGRSYISDLFDGPKRPEAQRAAKAIGAAASHRPLWNHVVEALADAGVSWRAAVCVDPHRFAACLRAGLVRDWVQPDPQQTPWPFRSDWRAAGGALDHARSLELAVEQMVVALGPAVSDCVFSELDVSGAQAVADVTDLSPVESAVFVSLIVDNVAGLSVGALADVARAVLHEPTASRTTACITGAA